MKTSSRKPSNTAVSSESIEGDLGSFEGTFQKSLSEDKSALLVTVEARALVEDIAKRVKAYPPAIKHLGEGVVGAILLHALGDTSEEEKLELQWRASGPFGNLFVDVLESGNVRGTIQNPRPEVYDFNQDLGDGLMQVRRVKEKTLSSTGIVQSQGKVAQDLVDYLNNSEQKSCLMNLFVDIDWDDEAAKKGDPTPFVVRRAEGFLIHILPSQDPKIKLEDYIRLWMQRTDVAGPLSQWAVPEDSVEKAHAFMLHLLTVGSKPSAYGIEGVNFECTCSEQRAERALALLSERERDHLAEENEGKEKVEIRCEYCGEQYDVALPSTE